MSGYFKSIFLILLIAIGVVSCSLIPNELETAEKLIETNTDSALHILQAIRPEQYKSDENRALYGLLMFQALDKKMLPLKPDSLLDYSIAWYEKNSKQDQLPLCYFYKGRSHKYSFQYENAITYYLKAMDECKDSTNNLLIGKINMDLGEIYNIQKDYKEARVKFKIAYNCFSKNNRQELAFHSLLFIGESYHDAKEYQTAGEHYRRIVAAAKDSSQTGFLYQDMGLNFYDSKQYDSAYYYFKKIINYPYIKNNKALRYLYLANVYFYFQKTDSAIICALNSMKSDADIRTQRECYRILTNSEYQRGNMKKMSEYMNLYVHIGDSIRKIDAQTKGSYIESKHYTELKYNRTRKILWYSIGFTLLVIVIAYIIYKRLNLKRRVEKIQLNEKHLNQNAEKHKDILVNHREVLQNKIRERKQILAGERKKVDSTGKEAIDMKLYEELLHINDIEYFYDEMNSVLNNLVNKIKSRYPAVTQREIMWCCLSLLHVPGVDMHLLLETNVDSLKKMKQRLAPKFNLSLVSELENFLLGLISE